jgi:hypothetical protein
VKVLVGATVLAEGQVASSGIRAELEFSLFR